MDKITRKERDDLRKRKEIIEAAREIFAAKGFHGATMAEISKISQYPLGTIYKYFPGKKEMYHDLVVYKVRELGHVLYEISQDSRLDAAEKLKAAMFAQADFYRANNEVVRIYISERSNIDTVLMPELNEKVNNLHKRMVDLLREIFDEGIKAGEFRNYPAGDMADLYFDISHSAAWASMFREEKKDQAEKRLFMIFEMFTKGIII